jgi:hypothetical protein
MTGVLRILLATVAVFVGVAAALFAVVAIAFRPPQPLAVPQPGALLVDVNTINPGGERRYHVDLTIRDGKIENIADHVVGGAEGQENYHLAGGFVLPGLIDLHVHSTQDPSGTSHDIELFSLLYLANGVTAVRDTGNFDGTILKTRNAIAKGQFAGPRIFACGPIFDGDPPFWPGSHVVHNAEEARRGVDEVAETGVDCIKAYSFLTADALAGLREGAAKHGLPIIGHVPLAVPFEDAHLDDVQHLTGVPRPIKTAMGWAAWAESWIQLDEARIEFIVRTSLEQGIAHTPTIVVWQQMAALVDYPALLHDPDAELLPRYYREVIWKPGGLVNTKGSPTDSWRALGAALPNMTLMVRRLHEAGVTLHVGTDVLNPFVIPGLSLHQELRNFVKAGFTP